MCDRGIFLFAYLVLLQWFFAKLDMLIVVCLFLHFSISFYFPQIFIIPIFIFIFILYLGKTIVSVLCESGNSSQNHQRLSMRVWKLLRKPNQFSLISLPPFFVPLFPLFFLSLSFLFFFFSSLDCSIYYDVFGVRERCRLRLPNWHFGWHHGRYVLRFFHRFLSSFALSFFLSFLTFRFCTSTSNQCPLDFARSLFSYSLSTLSPHSLFSFGHSLAFRPLAFRPLAFRPLAFRPLAFRPHSLLAFTHQ